jgi:hypothetical protein
MKVFRIATLATLVVAGLTFCSASAYAGPGSINKRQARQQARIYQGVKSGSLTLRETTHLEAQEARVAALEAKDRRTGGGLSPREHQQLERDLNRESRNIYRQKHDAQNRGGK